MKRALGFMNKALPITYNTYIGGVSATISTAALLATKLGISVGNISNFTIIGSDIKCRITGSYSVVWEYDNSLVSYKDTDGLVTDFSFRNCVNFNTGIDFSGVINKAISSSLRYSPINKIILKNCVSISATAFYHGDPPFVIRTYYIPNCTNLGGTSGNNAVFADIESGSIIYCHPSLQTNNAGSPDGDIALSISRGAIVRYVTNFTIPIKPTTANVSTIYNSAIQLIDPATSTNALEYYEVSVNGGAIFIVKVGEHITGLTPSTTYTITLIAVDILYNKSLVSDNLSISTNTTSAVSTTGLISYYKLEETAGTIAYDSFGSENLINDGVVINQTGLKNKCYLNNTSEKNLRASSIGTQITGNFSYNLWIKRTVNSGNYAGIIEQGQFGNGFGIWSDDNYRVGWRINSNYANFKTAMFLPINTWKMVTVVYDGATVKMYLDAVLQSTDSNTTNPNTASSKTLFARADFLPQTFLGNLDELAIYNRALTQAEIGLHYNSGIGITL